MSLTNCIHYFALSSIADSSLSLICVSETHHIHMFALTETGITHFTTSAELLDSVPTGFSLSLPHPVRTNNKNKIISGGTAFLVHDSYQILSSSSHVFKSFAISTVTLELLKYRFTVFNVYCPPSATKAVPLSQFLDDFQTLV
jgi:hypothetical protein